MFWSFGKSFLTMSSDKPFSVVSSQELHMPLVEGVQNLKEYGHRLVLELDDDRQVLVIYEREYGPCFRNILVDLLVKDINRLIVGRMFAGDEDTTQPHKRLDTLRSRRSVRRRVCSRHVIQAQRPINVCRDLLALLKNG